MRNFAGVAVATVLFGGTTASANSDPHRMFLPAGPFDIPAGVCAFPVHVDVPMNNEYAKVTDLARRFDAVRGHRRIQGHVDERGYGQDALPEHLGPQTIVFPAFRTDLLAHLLWCVTCLRDERSVIGVPNLMSTAGPFYYTTDTSNDTIVSVTRAPKCEETSAPRSAYLDSAESLRRMRLWHMGVRRTSARRDAASGIRGSWMLPWRDARAFRAFRTLPVEVRGPSCRAIIYQHAPAGARIVASPRQRSGLPCNWPRSDRPWPD